MDSNEFGLQIAKTDGSSAKMDNPITSEYEKHLKIGDIFTPQHWGEFAISEFGIFRKWMNGATVFDPTMGSGHLLEALLTFGLKEGYSINELPTKTLFGNELNTLYHREALHRFQEKYGIDMSCNFWNQDILDLTPRKFDILFGNPPWQNFANLPTDYKEKIKPLFSKYHLVGNARDLLLGFSRIDIAALIIQVSIKDFLNAGSEAYFFMPLSLLLNDGANEQFRTYSIDPITYAPQKIFDFNKEEVFSKASTRYGLVHFKRDAKPTYPLDYMILDQKTWKKYLASPIQNDTSPLSIYEDSSQKPLAGFKSIELSKTSTPRQGINTCGANNVFFFTRHKTVSDSICIVNENIELPSKFVFPLLKSSNFKTNDLTPVAWVLIPHNPDGRPLSPEELELYPALKQYLNTYQQKLMDRKGTLIGSWLKKGRWWALLGVGPYNYAAHKIVWEAYGRNNFDPILVEGFWQANQSLQAFMPFQTISEAGMILEKLKNPAIQKYLLSLKMEGTMNWAQPGKIKKLIAFKQ